MIRAGSALAALICSLTLTGCSGVVNLASTGDNIPSSGSGAAFHGIVHGGQQPIQGASIYLYAANTTGYGAQSVSLLTGAANTSEDVSNNYYVTTGSDGTFSITGDYSCPSASSQVYLYSIGGSSISGSSPPPNTAAGLLAGLGPCGNITSSTYILINEVSTVVTAYAIAGFASDATHVSSPNSTLGLAGIANAFAAIPNLECVADSSLLCMQSGGTNFTGFAIATTPAGNGTVPLTEINSLANILAACVNSPAASSTGCTNLLGTTLASGTAGTQPTDTATAAINIAHNPWANIATLYGLPTPSPPFQPALSSQPNDWTISIDYSAGLDGATVAIDGSGNVWFANFANNLNPRKVVELSPTGSVLSGNGYPGAPGSHVIAIDSSGDVWTAAEMGPVTELSPEGVRLNGSGSIGNGLDGPTAMAIDSTGNLWFASYYNDELSEFSSSGQIVSGSPFFSGGIYPIAMAIDTSVNLWLANQGDSLSELSSAGHAASGSPFRGAGLNSPAAIAIDDSGNVWVANQAGNSLSEFNSSGQAAAGSPFSGGGLASPDAIAIDGSGNIWAADDVPTPPPSSPSSSCCLSEFNSSGTAISPPSGYQAGELNGAGPIAIDGSGNIWVVNGLDALEFVGLATPVVTPIVANLLSPYGQYAVNKP